MQIGIDLGSQRIKLVIIEEGGAIRSVPPRKHGGQISLALTALLEESLPKEAGFSLGWTGQVPAVLEEDDRFCRVDSSRALFRGVASLHPDAESVLEAGAQTSLFINGLKDKSRFTVEETMGCSAGTGSFFDEQMGRLGYEIEDLNSFARGGGRIPRIAGRCTVFARTDIIHRQQEGYDISEILTGLSYAVAKSVKGFLFKNKTVLSPLYLGGGVSLNRPFVQALEEVAGLKIALSPHAEYFNAVGAALEGTGKNHWENPETLIRRIRELFQGGVHWDAAAFRSGFLAPLAGAGKGDGEGKHSCLKSIADLGKVFLGIDVGSTSTNLLLFEEGRGVIDYVYTGTRGDPLGVIRRERQKLRERYELPDNLLTGITGSGRRFCAEELGIPHHCDEITAQAGGAAFSCPEGEIIFEIGGQDSKYIRMARGGVEGFAMNRVCAAGTGAFLEEQAHRMNRDIRSFVDLALEGNHPVDLDENCTVFMQNSVGIELEKGTLPEDIAAGLCYAVVRNYLKRVVGEEIPEGTILLQGGIAFNQAVVNAFRILTGRTIFVPPYFSVTGALGAALFARDASLRAPQPVAAEELPPLDYHAALTAGYEEPRGERRSKRIGIPRVLFLYKMFPLFFGYFKQLGFEVVLSPETDEEIVAASQGWGAGEPCYPVKLIFGHVTSLLEKGIDYLFFPSLITMKHEGSGVRCDYACLMMQTSPSYIARAMGLQEKGVALLSPHLKMDLGKKEMARALRQLGRDLGYPRGAVLAAMAKGIGKFAIFQKSLSRHGKEWLRRLDPCKPAFLLITRTYGLHDRELNKGIPRILRELGVPFLTLSSIPIDSYDLEDHPNMYWPFGQHILKGINTLADRPHLHPIYLTNHGCGPDTILLHYVEERMDGRAFLHIEVDEHASGEGIRTRIEAFVSSVTRDTAPVPPWKKPSSENVPFRGLPGPDEEIFVPPYIPYQEGERIIPPRSLAQASSQSSSMVRTKEDPALRALWSGLLSWLEEDPRRRHVYLPVNEGAGTDGQYARLIRFWLDRKGRRDVRLHTPHLEDFLQKPEDEFQRYIHETLKSDLRRWASDAGLALASGTPADMAREYRRFLGSKNTGIRAKVLLTGDPWILFDPHWLTRDVILPLRKGGCLPVRMPLSEMLFLFFRRRGKGSPREEGNLAYLEERLMESASLLGEASPFSDHPAALAARAEALLPEVSGGHLPYLAAKASLAREEGRFSQVLHTAGLYDNGAPLLEQLAEGNGALFPYKGPQQPSDRKVIDHLLFRLEGSSPTEDSASRGEAKTANHNTV